MMRSIEEGLNPGKAEDAKKAITEQIPIGHYSEAIEIAKLVIITDCDDSGFISGSHYQIDDRMAAK